MGLLGVISYKGLRGLQKAFYLALQGCTKALCFLFYNRSARAKFGELAKSMGALFGGPSPEVPYWLKLLFNFIRTSIQNP